MGPRATDKCPYERYTGDTDQRGGSSVTVDADWSDAATSQEIWSHQKPEEARNGFSPRASGGRTSGLQNSEKINFDCFNQPRFVAVGYRSPRKPMVVFHFKDVQGLRSVSPLECAKCKVICRLSEHKATYVGKAEQTGSDKSMPLKVVHTLLCSDKGIISRLRAQTH